MTRSSAMKACELGVPLDASHAELVRSFIREAVLAGEAPQPCAALLAADVAEAWMALSFGSPGDDRARILLSLTHSEARARIMLHGHGRTAALPALLSGRLRPGAGIACHDSGVDACELILHRSLNATPPVFPSASEPASAPAVHAEDIRIERADQSDTASIARCFLAVYGHHYIHGDVYSPRRYWRRVESGELIPVVARDSSGDVIGHLALERDPGARIAERGEAVVLPAYRGQHLLERMSAQLTEEAAKHGLDGIYSEALTIHTFSQRNDERSGMPICAALLGANPESFRPMDVACPTAGQRQSYLRTFRFIQSPAARTIHVADAYRDATLKIYESLGVQAVVAPRAEAAATSSATRVRVNDRGYGAIRFERIGRNCAVEAEQALRDVQSLGARSVQLSALVSDPGLPGLIAAARGLGFFFCGLAPSFADGEDLFLLQFLSEPLDIGKLQIYTPAAKEMLAFIEQDRRATAGR